MPDQLVPQASQGIQSSAEESNGGRIGNGRWKEIGGCPSRRRPVPSFQKVKGPVILGEPEQKLTQALSHLIPGPEAVVPNGYLDSEAPRSRFQGPAVFPRRATISTVYGHGDVPQIGESGRQRASKGVGDPLVIHPVVVLRYCRFPEMGWAKHMTAPQASFTSDGPRFQHPLVQPFPKHLRGRRPLSILPGSRP